MHFFLPISRELYKKYLPSKWKKRSKPRLRGPLCTFPLFILLAASNLDFERKRGQTSGVVTSTKTGLLTLILYLNTARVWVGPKTKFMVSWLLGKFVPESKPFLFFTGCTIALRKKTSFIFCD